ncbi:MAG: hypothetical protein GEV08_02760 [Acidimicrobiia bacterium]|nr:hypothetical protein [Acidimicrobiia bacterium]
MAQARDASGTVNELKDLLVAYAKQETVDPLKALGRYLGFGLAGSLLMGLASIFLPLALLRALQAETGTALYGNWSWLPYAATLVVVVLVVGLILLGLRRVKATQMKKAADASAPGTARSER